MALIDFKCTKCGEKFEEIVKLSDRENIKCPKCGSEDIKQVFEGKSAVWDHQKAAEDAAAEAAEVAAAAIRV